MKSIFNALKNLLIYAFIFVTVFMVSTMALARKINSYRSNFNNQTFEVEKEEIVLINPYEGRIAAVHVNPGEHVSKGDILVEMTDDAYESRLDVLNDFSESNLSARTEAELLRLRQNDYTIRAPRDGIIKEIDLAAGSFISANSKLLSMYADDNAKLVIYVDTLSLDEIQKTDEVEVYSPRLEESFDIKLSGVSESDPENQEYKAIFAFTNQSTSSYLLNGEKVEAVPAKITDVRRPADILTDIWNGLIIQQKQS